MRNRARKTPKTQLQSTKWGANLDPRGGVRGGSLNGETQPTACAERKSLVLDLTEVSSSLPRRRDRVQKVAVVVVVG